MPWRSVQSGHLVLPVDVPLPELVKHTLPSRGRQARIATWARVLLLDACPRGFAGTVLSDCCTPSASRVRTFWTTM
jgi:hypothetical protein